MNREIDNTAKRFIKKELRNRMSPDTIRATLLSQGYNADDTNYHLQTIQADLEDRKEINKGKSQYIGGLIGGLAMLVAGLFSLFNNVGAIYIGLIIVGGGLFFKSLAELTR